MVPSNAILDAIQTLLATDTGTLAPAALALKVHLAAAAFTPGAGLDLTTLVEATFDGATALAAGVGACEMFYDQTTGLRVVQLNEPARGWHWQVTGATHLDQTVFGLYVTDSTDAVLYGSNLISPPAAMSVIGKGLDVPYIRFTFATGSPY